MYIGIDIGTQSLKAVVTGAELQPLASASAAYPVHHPRPGWAEQDPRDWERALAATVAEALVAAGAAPEDIAAIGIAGQLDGCIGVDVGGLPLTPCLIWMDRRATACMPELPDDFRRRTGINPDPGHMAAKIGWLRDRGAARFHQPVSYLVSRLTGEAAFDPAHASTTMLYELGASSPAADLCALFDIDPASLPRVSPAASVAGALHRAGAALANLPAGVPVAVGSGDDFATPIGAGVRDGVLVSVLGTAEVCGALYHEPVIDPIGLVETHPYPAGGYFVENPGWTAGGAVAWARELFGFESDAALDAAAASVPPGADGLLFLPALSGAMAPRWDPALRGCFYGLTPSHGRGHHARAVLEGCAFACRDVQLRLEELGVGIESALALGGGAASDLWLRIRSDVMGLEHRRVVGGDSCALGAAALAIAAHENAPVAEVTKRVPEPESVAEPDSERHRIYRDAHARYLELFESLARGLGGH